MSNDRRMVARRLDTGEERPLDPSPETTASMYELALETLVWENGGSLIISRERFERARKDSQKANGGRVTTLRMSMTKDYLDLSLADGDTDTPVRGAQ